MTLCNLSRFVWSFGSAALAALVLVGCLPSVVEKHVLVTVVVVEQVPVTVEVPVTVLVRDITQSTATPPPAGTPTRLGASSSPVPADTRVNPTVYLVANTNGDGVYIRRSPDLADRIKAWPEDTPMIQIGPAVVVDYVKWRNVRDPDGNDGFVPSSYLLSETQAAARDNRPANTPRPQTAKPAPTPQSQAAGCTAAARRYVGQVDQRLGAFNGPFAQLLQDLQSLANNPSRFFDRDAAFVVKQQLLRVSNRSNSLAGTKPRDPAAIKIHERLDTFSGYLAVASSSLIAGLEDGDTSEFRRGLSDLQDAADELQAGLSLMEKCI